MFTEQMVNHYELVPKHVVEHTVKLYSGHGDNFEQMRIKLAEKFKPRDTFTPSKLYESDKEILTVAWTGFDYDMNESVQIRLKIDDEERNVGQSAQFYKL